MLAKTIESMKETTGLDLTEVMRANTYDAKVTKNVTVSGIPEGTDNADTAVSVAMDVVDEM